MVVDSLGGGHLQVIQQVVPHHCLLPVHLLHLPRALPLVDVAQLAAAQLLRAHAASRASAQPGICRVGWEEGGGEVHLSGDACAGQVASSPRPGWPPARPLSAAGPQGASLHGQRHSRCRRRRHGCCGGVRDAGHALPATKRSVRERRCTCVPRLMESHGVDNRHGSAREGGEGGTDPP